MFHYDRGLKLTQADLAIDFTRRQPRGFVSHAHHDHMARHQLALCTPATADLYRLRLGPRDVLPLPYREPREWGGLRLTTYPAGHCLGSAMLYAEDGAQSLLYTGDFKLAPAITCESAELPRADVLVMESTYGHPKHRHPPRAEVAAQLADAVRAALAREQTPVVLAYAVGKAQEVTAILAQAGISVLQHRDVFAVSEIYRQHGVELGPHYCYDGRAPRGHALVAPPYAKGLHRLRNAYTIGVTGWAATHGGWGGADVVLPLSDHADFAELLTAVERVQPRVVYCTHGPASFVEHLREQGWNAQRLGEPATAVQARLF